MNTPINATTPVIIAAAAVSQKIDNPELLLDGKDAVGLMVDAAKKAANKHLEAIILSEVDAISVCQGMWGFNNPAALMKEAVGATNAETIFQKIGVLQQDVISEACLAIQSGKKSFCLVAGGEAKYRDLMAGIHQITLPSVEAQSEPDRLVEPEQELWLSAETDAGLGMPVGYYALMDSVYQKDHSLTVEQHRHRVAELYHDFSDVAASNPDAWKQQVVEADDIKNASDKNPMLAFPYTKRHNSSWNVDQASAILICSTEKATALGVDQKHWIFPVAATASNHMLAVSEREHLARCPGAEEAAKALYELSNMAPVAIDLVELYSCFPVGVLSFVDALGLEGRSSLTTTGGMPFAGGPLNNYVIQSTVKTLELLESINKVTALVSNISGMNTKQGLFLYSKNYQPFQYQDVTEKVAQVQTKKTVLTDYQGQATIVASTVLFQKNTAERVVVIAENESGERVVAYSQDAALFSDFEKQTQIGKSVAVEQGIFCF
ncbi:MAG: hypothetical protein OXE99_11510 [Cellvibrionales bacterium]|nr:hypothetical protein [Cellvibrionales bacterium]